MAKTIKKCCGTCAHARWEYGPKGGRMTSVIGTCMAIDPDKFREELIKTIPGCIVPPTIHKVGVWPKDGNDCPAYEPEK